MSAAKKVDDPFVEDDRPPRRTRFPRTRESLPGNDARPDSGRPPSYRPEYPAMAYAAISDFGAGIDQLGNLFGVDGRTVSVWMNTYSLFHRAVINGRDAYDNRSVEKTLLERAKGYTYDEIRTEDIELVQGRGPTAIRVPAKKTTRINRHVPGDPYCIMFWLTNRHPDRWKTPRKLDQERGGSGNGAPTANFDWTKLSKDELDLMRRLVERATGGSDGTGPSGQSSINVRD